LRRLVEGAPRVPRGQEPNPQEGRLSRRGDQMLDRMSDGIWKALRDHHARIRDVHLRQLFADDPRRGDRLAVEGVGLYLDYSKHRITDETLRLLVRLAAARGLRGRIDAMYSGEKINTTEGRAVLHIALRAPRHAQ